ncbi:Calx-beta domain-containing protein [Limisphaera sp. 4302-co]|uniref:Calx-beta domain-containing protein n=1 Tax=Limisphaera sp. 4302-co TaxID=3400417 RepID=UPI003C14F071
MRRLTGKPGNGWTRRWTQWLVCGLAFGWSVASWAQPANDNFTAAEELTGIHGTVEGSLDQATFEIGEPSHAGFPVPSIWYRWTAPRSGEVTWDTLASPGGPDTVLAVYTGETLQQLRQVAANDDAPPVAYAKTPYGNLGSLFGFLTGRPSALRFHAEEGRTYYIAVGLKLGLLPQAGADVILSWAYHSGGVFRFATEDIATALTPEGPRQVPVVHCSEWESLATEDASTVETYYRFGVPGVLVTVTRVGGASGRMLVDYATEEIAEDEVLVPGQEIPAVAFQDFIPVQGTLVFDHGEMTKRILIRIVPDDMLPNTNRSFAVVLSNARPDPNESLEVAPPRVDGAFGRILVRILDTDIDPVWQRNFQAIGTNDPPDLLFQPTNAIFNFTRVAYRTPEDVNEYYARVRIGVMRSGTNRESVTLRYRVNNFLGSGDQADPAELDNNIFPLQPGSDCATPTPPDDPIGIHGTNSDFEVLGNYSFPGGGSLDWGQDDFRVKEIELIVTNDTLTEFNEDFQLFLYRNVDNRPTLVGTINQTTVTILFDDRDPPAGSVDQFYNPDFGATMVPAVTTSPPNLPNPGTDGVVYDLALQSDNRAIIVGDFTSYNTIGRSRIARLNVDGSLDTSFSPGTGADAFIAAIAASPGGQWVIGGGFASYNGQRRVGVARINANGSLDPTFDPADGPNGAVWAVAVAPDGKVYIGGEFTAVNGIPRPYVARLNRDGSVDTGFDPGVGPDGPVWALELQPDGRLLIGGEFYRVSGVVRGGIARLLDDGRLDATFNPGAGTDGRVFAIRRQPDGRVLIGGEFSSVNLQPRNNLARLTAGGALDPAFDPGSTGTDGPVYAIELAGGRIYIGGSFDTYNGTPRRSFARLYEDGTLDTTFLDTAYNQFAGLFRARFADPRGIVFATKIQSDGNVLIAGLFDKVGGGQASALVRPEANGDPNLWIEHKSRDGVRNRSNVARLVGGETPGPGNIGFARSSYTANENQSMLSVDLVRTNGALGYLSANFEVEDGLARSGTDYIYNAVPPIYLTSWQAPWPANEPGATTRMMSDGLFGDNFVPTSIFGQRFFNYREGWLNITILNDQISQGDRNTTFRLASPTFADVFFLGGENIPLGGALGRSRAPLNIVDDDKQAGVLGFASTNFVVLESAGQAVITVIRTNGSFGTLTCQYEVMPGGTATPNTDYQPRSGTLTFLNGVTNQTFVIPIFNDSQVEPDETVRLRLIGVAVGGISNTVLTIVDDDTPGGRLNFDPPVVGGLEGSGRVQVTVTRRGSSSGTLTVTAVTEDGTATAGSDYLPVSTVLTWAHGDVSPKTFWVSLVDDGAIEPDETVVLRLMDPMLNGVPNPGALGPQAVGTLWITNDDRVGFVAFPYAEYRVNENGGKALITVVRTDGAAGSVTVNFRAEPGTAVPFTDFVPTNGSLSFGPGETAKSFEIQILDGPFADAADRFVTLTLSGANPGSALGQPATAILRIVDDESVNEPAGELDTLFGSGHFNDAVLALGLQPDGKLLVAGDFTLANDAIRLRLVRLNGGDGSLDPSFSASVNGAVNALLPQADGRIVIGGAFSQVNGLARPFLARVQTNGVVDTTFDPGSGPDQPVFALAESWWQGQPRMVVGGAFATYRGVGRRGVARLLANGALDTSFDPGTGANGTVYAVVAYPTNSVHAGKILVAGEFTEFNGRTSPGIVRLNPDGSVDPTFRVGTGPDGAVRAVLLQPDGRIVIGGSFTNVNGQTRVRLARLLDNGDVDATFDPGAGADDTVWALALQRDLRIVVGGAFRHCNGVTRGGITRLNPDGSADPSINFGAGADAFVAAVLVQPDGKIILGGGFETYDGQPRRRLARIYGGSVSGSGRIEFAKGRFVVWEDQTNAVVTLRRRGGTANAPDGQPVRARFATADGTATNQVHYVGGSYEVAFPQAEVFAEVQIPLVDDFELNPARSFWVSITNLSPAGAPGLALGNQPIAEVQIVSDDTGVSFSQPNFAVSENVAGGLARITIQRQGNLERTTVVDFTTTTNGTATAGTDFVHLTNTLTFLPGETTRFVFIPILDDAQPEGEETVTMALTNVTGGFLVSPFEATLTILDDERAPGEIRLVQSNVWAGEAAGQVAIPLVRTNGRSGVVTVGYETREITATAGLDFVRSGGFVTFGDGETNKVILIPILNDSLVEGEETFLLVLTNVTGGARLQGPTNAVVTIADDELGFGFAAPTFLASEADGGLTFLVRRVGDTNRAVQVSYTTEDESATAGRDYVATSGSLSFAPGESLKSVSVPLLEDRLVEGDETFRLRLLQPSPGTEIIQPTAVGVILDNDAGFKLATNRYTVAESHTNGLATNVVVEVIRVGSLHGTNSVGYTTVGGSAVAGQDFATTAGTLVFTNGESMKQVVVPILDDTLVEETETFAFQLVNPDSNSSVVEPSTATISIVDDDAGLRFLEPAYTISEGGVSVTLTVERTGVLDTPVSVEWRTEDGSARAGQDYVQASGRLNFTNGVARQTLTVSVLDDTDEEGTESFSVRLFNVTGPATLVAPESATVTIVDNDGGVVVPAGSKLLSDPNGNGALDPGERVTVRFAMRNAGTVPLGNVVATLLATNGVVQPGPARSYGALAPNGPSVSRDYSFTVQGTNGSLVRAVFLVRDGDLDLGRVTFSYLVGTRTATFSNTAQIEIRDDAAAVPYPSVISVTGLVGVVSKTVVTLTNLHHARPSDIDMLLVSPAGGKVMVMSDAGAGYWVTNVTLTLDDAAAQPLPETAPLVSGTFKPTNYGAFDLLDVPAPEPPYATSLSAFNDTNPNGQWRLFIRDDAPAQSGHIRNGWLLQITTSGRFLPEADLSVTAETAASTVVGSNWVLTLQVRNHGPWDVTGVNLTNLVPEGAVLVSSQVTQGQIQTNNGTVRWSVGDLAMDQDARATLVLRSDNPGVLSWTVGAWSAQAESHPGNNTADLQVEVLSPRADLEVFLADEPDPVALGGLVSYTAWITNHGPATAERVTLTNRLPAGFAVVQTAPGVYLQQGNQLIFRDLGNLGAGAGMMVRVTVRPAVAGEFPVRVDVGSATDDPAKANNVATVRTTVTGTELRARVTNGQLELRWPVTAGNVVLERADTLTPPVQWVPVQVMPVLDGDHYRVNLPLDGSGGFFRLRMGP